MDARLFDAHIRRLAVALPRRRALSPVAGLATALLVSRQTAAGCKKVGKKCKKNKDCCAGAKCKEGKKGRCRCKSGRADCNGDGTCLNLNTNEAHCGACGIVCLPPDRCCDGVCSTACVI